MDITVNRTDETKYGIFGEIPKLNLVTLEHAYPSGDGSFHPKVPNGRYLCVRGKHALPDGYEFETFEVTNVPGHTGILFHSGNKNDDSAGCFLLGSARFLDRGIIASRTAFQDFMNAQEDVNQFFLTVSGPVAHNTP